jgi:hypothetical protein
MLEETLATSDDETVVEEDDCTTVGSSEIGTADEERVEEEFWVCDEIEFAG